jgi:ubiquinone/menaquinone biosynthesis C-methylase UbiE
MAGSLFDSVAEEYDAARPSYPDAIYDELEKAAGPLAGQLVLDGGAGTGIASRQLAARGARLVALDLSEPMLRRALARSPRLCWVVADGDMMPLRASCIDLACFAQSWHWFDPVRACAEIARVIRPGGYWAAWWNEAAADGEDWLADYHAAMAAACPAYSQHRRAADAEWSAAPIAATSQFSPGGCVVTQWTRTPRLDEWLTDQRSKSYVAALQPADRDRLLSQIAAIVTTRFPDGQLSVPYQTRMWLARRH